MLNVQQTKRYDSAYTENNGRFAEKALHILLINSTFAIVIEQTDETRFQAYHSLPVVAAVSADTGCLLCRCAMP